MQRQSMTLWKCTNSTISDGGFEMPRDDTRQKKILIKGTGPKKVPPRPDYGGKPPGANPVAPKPDQSGEGQGQTT